MRATGHFSLRFFCELPVHRALTQRQVMKKKMKKQREGPLLFQSCSTSRNWLPPYLERQHKGSPFFGPEHVQASDQVKGCMDAPRNASAASSSRGSHRSSCLKMRGSAASFKFLQENAFLLGEVKRETLFYGLPCAILVNPYPHRAWC